MGKDAPSNASELVGERDGEDVVMQPLLGRFEPRLEPVTIPALLSLRSVSTTSGGRRQVPAPASPIARAGVRIWRAESINARHARKALLLRGVAAVDPAMAGAVICAPTAVGTGASRGKG